jgi:hypothetical protein
MFASRRSYFDEIVRSLRLDVGLLDDRPPLFNLSFLESAERFRRLPLARKNLLAEPGDPPHRQSFDEDGIEFADDCFRGSLGTRRSSSKGKIPAIPPLLGAEILGSHQLTPAAKAVASNL